jgi:hypothetical protein
MIMRVQNADDILVKMASLLQDAGVLEKTAAPESTPELDAIAGSIMSIADQLDMAGAGVAAERLDTALARMAEAGCSPDIREAAAEPAGDRAVVLKAAATTLIRIADRLDELEMAAANDIDRALTALSGLCMCKCSKCSAAQSAAEHCHNADTQCFAAGGGEEPQPL